MAQSSNSTTPSPIGLPGLVGNMDSAPTNSADPLSNLIKELISGHLAQFGMSVPSKNNVNPLPKLEDTPAQQVQKNAAKGQSATKQKSPSFQGFVDNVTGLPGRISVKLENLAHPLLALFQNQKDQLEQTDDAPINVAANDPVQLINRIATMQANRKMDDINSSINPSFRSMSGGIIPLKG